MAICKHCNSEVSFTAKECPECGVDFPAVDIKCKHCKQSIPLDGKPCPYCGVEKPGTATFDFKVSAWFLMFLGVLCLIPPFTIIGVILLAIAILLFIKKSPNQMISNVVNTSDKVVSESEAGYNSNNFMESKKIDFIAIDFETGNSKRVSACALGLVKVSNGRIIETKGYLIKPVGGHDSFETQIHGIEEKHTFDKPEFGELFSEIKDIFKYPLVAHSLFDKQVLNAVSDHFNLGLEFDYIDTCALARIKLPHLKNHKLKTLVEHFDLPAFKHHDATEDAIACANIFLNLQDINLDK